MEVLNSISMQGSLNASAPPLSQVSQESLAESSWNSIVSGDGLTRGFSGMTSQGAGTGARKMVPFGKVYGGIRDIGLIKGSGSFIEDVGRSRWGIGSGQAMIEGVDVAGFTLSTNLKVSVSPFSSIETAGLNQPSAPDIGIILTTGDVNNSISAKIERRRASTGARSVASPTSAVILPQSNRIRVGFPAATTGQTHWRVYFTFHGFGGTGIHYLAVYDAVGGVPNADIPESVVAASSVDGIARSIEFNYKDGDLLPVEASYDDYAPPAATHLIRLQNVMNLAGCYSAGSATAENTGTAIAVSKINNYESYIPTHLLFLPEQVTDTLSRPVDDFGYVACENSIHAIQYVGDRGDDLPPCTITTILPDVGIKYPHNWAHFRGRLLMYSAEGNLIMMTEGGDFDSIFASPITKIIKDWNPEDTIVGYDPKNDIAILANKKIILCYSLTTETWRQIFLPDFAVTGSSLSCISAKRRLYISIASGASNTAYTFDTGNMVAPITVCSNYQNRPSGNALVKDIFEITAAADTSETSVIALCVSRELRQSSWREVKGTIGNFTIESDGDVFTAAMVGKRFFLAAPNIGGAGIDYIVGKFLALVGAGLQITTLGDVPINLPVTFSDALMFVGDYVAVRTMTPTKRHLRNFFPNLPESHSYQVSFYLKGSKERGNVLGCDIFGVQYPASRAR